MQDVAQRWAPGPQFLPFGWNPGHWGQGGGGVRGEGECLSLFPPLLQGVMLWDPRPPPRNNKCLQSQEPPLAVNLANLMEKWCAGPQ